MRNQSQENQNQDQITNNLSNSSFNLPLDIFNTEKSYIIHIAIPGAKKENISIN